MAALSASGCGGLSLDLGGGATDGGSSYTNPNSAPDAIAPGVSIIVENQETAMKVVVDEKRIYWQSSLPNGFRFGDPPRYARIRGCQKSDCSSTIVDYDVAAYELTGKTPPPDHPSFHALATHGDNVYWARGSTVLTCPSTGCAGAPRVVVDNASLSSMAIDETHVYWTSQMDTAILRMPLAGTGSPEAVALNESRPDRVVADETNVYWIADPGEAHSSIKRVAKQGGERPVTLVTEQNQATDLVVTGGFFYWANSHLVGAIFRCPVSGCEGAPTVLAADQNRPSALAADGKSIFWLSIVEPGVDMKAAVKRCPIDDCASATDTLAVQMFARNGMSTAVDRSDVFWVAQGDALGGTGTGFYPYATIYRHRK